MSRCAGDGCLGPCLKGARLWGLQEMQFEAFIYAGVLQTILATNNKLRTFWSAVS